MFNNYKLLLVLAIFSFGLLACDQSPIPTEDTDNAPVALASPPQASANPAIVYNTFGSNSYIGVMDSTGNNQTTIYTTSATINNANWSSSNSIVWTERQSSSTWAVRAAEVTVGSNGVPAASNVRTLTSTSGSPIFKAVWSSTSSVNKIAMVCRDSFGTSNGDFICTMSSSGGGSDTLYTAPAGADISIKGLSWSPDDSKLAVLISAGSWNSFVIINTSTKAVTDSINVGLMHSGGGLSGAYNFEWSRTGSMNKLAFVSNNKIYYVTPTSGSTATTNSVEYSVGGALTWSPSNSHLMYRHSNTNGTSALKKNKAQTTTVSTIDKDFPTVSMNWHR